MDKLNEEEKEIVKCTFVAALEFLSLVGDNDQGATAKNDLVPKRDAPSKHQQSPSAFATKRRLKPVVKEQAVTASKKRKLERIKAPVVVFRKTKTLIGPSEEEQDKSVKKTLAYLVQLPQQEIYKPPPAPVVTVNIDLEQSSSGTVTDSPHNGTCEPVGVQEYEYLTSEKDIALWKLISSSPTNCNVFVGNLSQQVSNVVLAATFEEFCDQNIKDNMKVRVVMDVSKRQSKGYGFVSFPVRRAAEMALICMQEFELYGRVMQLGWGQEEKNASASSSLPLSLASSATVSPIQPSSTTVSPIQPSSAAVNPIQPSSACITPRSSATSHVTSATPNVAALATVRKLVGALPALRRVPRSQTFATDGKDRLEEPIAKKMKTGQTFSDTLYHGQCRVSKSETVLKKKSRWDQETRRAARSDCSTDSHALEDNHWPLDNKVTAADITGELEPRVTQGETRENLLALEKAPRDSLSLSNENENTNPGFVCAVEVPSFDGVCTGETEDESKDACSEEHGMALEDKATSDEHEVEISVVAAVGKPVNKGKVKNTSATCQSPSAVSSKDYEAAASEAIKAQKVPVARKLQWVTREQKVELLKLVCARLRAIGVTGHVGVFGHHYEADNSRLYIVCAKHVTEAELMKHFAQFGAAEIKLNRDPKGASKGCAFVHYINPSDATTALKSSHGQVLGGLPLKVMVAEPKSRTGSKKSTRNS